MKNKYLFSMCVFCISTMRKLNISLNPPLSFSSYPAGDTLSTVLTESAVGILSFYYT